MTKTLLEAHWRLAEPDMGKVAAIADALRLPELIARLLVNRGIDSIGDAEKFITPSLDDLHDPYTLPDVEAAVDRLSFAITKGETIFVHGDYDADGVTSAALCLRALEGMGAKVVGFVPRRTDGYDFQPYGAEKAKEAGASLILTADCGVCAVEAVDHANSLGLDVVITDHHRPNAVLPSAVAVVNPYRTDSKALFRDLCGAGVAFKVLDALAEKQMPQHRAQFRRSFVDLVAMGTVADVTTLSGENRILVYHGLLALERASKSGVRALLASAGLDGQPLSAEKIGFNLAPRLNAAGRMEDADLAYRLLISRDADEAEQLAAQLESLNDLRKVDTERIVSEALAEAMSAYVGDRVLVLARPRWGKGLVGIAAARVVEMMRKPTLILSTDEQSGLAHGSGRTFGDFNLLAALHGCADLLGRFGGHNASAGLSLPLENLVAFRARINEQAEGLLEATPSLPTLTIDAELTHGSALTNEFVELLQWLQPYGRDNPEPMFLTTGAVVTEARRVGKDQNTAWFQFRLPGRHDTIKGVRFKSGDWTERVAVGDRVDLVYTPKRNEWKGRVTVDLTLHDLRPTL